MKRAVLLIASIFILTSCATLSNPDKWHTIVIDKHWPDGYKSWTYKRCCGQNLVWALFGNDNDGVTPWFRGEPWPFWKWWPRNAWHNFNWYGRGYARWIEGDPYASWDISHLEYKMLIGKRPPPGEPPDDDQYGLIFWLIKPKLRSWLAYRPYLRLNTKYFRIWRGWGKRGQFHSSIEFGED